MDSSGGIISATSTQSGGGNIDIAADDIRLRNSSLISTSVFDSTGGGGNITINSTIFFAREDSDILANAQAGPGGNITIKSPAFIANLFSSGAAVAVGRNPGDLAQFRGNERNDISVSVAGSFRGNAQVNTPVSVADSFRGNGQVNISAASATGASGIVNIPDVGPGGRTAQLPSNVVDATGLIDRRCNSDRVAQRSSFTVTGRGGLPPNPNEPLIGETVIANWVNLDPDEEKRDRFDSKANPTSTPPKQLVEAQGWVINPNGQVILTAQAVTVTPQSLWQTTPSCQSASATTK